MLTFNPNQTDALLVELGVPRKPVYIGEMMKALAP